MVTLTVTEATLNATRAALEERVKRLEREITRSREFAAAPMENGKPLELTEDAQRALVWNIAALHETKTAIEDISEDAIEQADPVTAAKAYAELGYHDAQIAYGEPEGDSDVFTNREGMPEFNGAFR
jgi:hypothetical protein